MDLAPLDPDRFLAWVWAQGPRARGTAPHTIADLWFMYVEHDRSITVETVRRWQVRLASKVRRNQRLGLGPWEGLC